MTHPLPQHSASGDRHPEQWVIRVCPLCRCQVYEMSISHTGDCANRNKIFVPDELFVVPKPGNVEESDSPSHSTNSPFGV